MAEERERGVAGRGRGLSLSLPLSLLNATPQLGMWQATGTAIAQAPNLAELREPEAGGSNITFDAHGHSTRIARPDDDGELTLVKTPTTALATVQKAPDDEARQQQPHKHHGLHRRQTLKEKHASPHKLSWGATIKNGLRAFWVCT